MRTEYEQVLNAQDAGFSMVIVYDYQQGELFTMTRPGEDEESASPGRAVEIPLVSDTTDQPTYPPTHPPTDRG